jgi:hypothetical protein
MADLYTETKPAVTGLTSEEQKNLIKVLTENHPLYNQHIKSWKMYIDAYKGGPYVKNYIYQHLRESDLSVKKRRDRATYPNYVKPILDLYLGYIFRRPIDRTIDVDNTTEGVSSALQEEMEDFLNNCDGKRTHIESFMKRAGLLSRIFGYSAILVDLPNADEPIISEADRKVNNITPYCSLYTPLDVVNWEVDAQGRLLWVRIKEEVSKQTGIFIKEEERGRALPTAAVEELEKKSLTKDAKSIMPIPIRESIFFSRKGTPIKRYTTWTRDGWITHQIRSATKDDPMSSGKEVVEVIDKGDHVLGEVPITFVYNEVDILDPVIGNSFLQDIAPLNIQIMNWMSMLDEEIAQKCLNILVMKAESGAEVVIGSNNVLTYEGDQVPQFIAPAATPGELIQTSIEKARDEIYRLAKLTGGVGVLKEVRSGIAYSYEFSETEQSLANIADELERAEENIHRLWCKWLGSEWKGNIDYPDEFGIEDILSDLKVLDQAIGMVQSPTFSSEIQKKILNKILPKINEEQLKEMEDEIDANVDLKLENDLQRMQQQQQMNSINMGGGQPPPEQGGTVPPEGKGGEIENGKKESNRQ